MKWYTLLIVVLCAQGCAHNDEWSRGDTDRFIAYAVAGAADTYTTSRFQYHPELEEANPIVAAAIGRNPSTSDLWQGWATVTISNYFIARALPEKWRKRYINTWTVAHGTLAIYNCGRLSKLGDC